MRQLLLLEDRSDAVGQIIKASASADYICKVVKTFIDFVDAFDELGPDLVMVQVQVDERMVVDCLSHLSNRKWRGCVLLTCTDNQAYLEEVAELAKNNFRLPHVEILPAPLDVAKFQSILKTVNEDQGGA